MIQQQKLILLALSGLFLVSCSPQKKDESQGSSAIQQDANKPSEGTLSPSQEDQLKIDEDNVMEPLPG